MKTCPFTLPALFVALKRVYYDIVDSLPTKSQSAKIAGEKYDRHMGISPNDHYYRTSNSNC